MTFLHRIQSIFRPGRLLAGLGLAGLLVLAGLLPAAARGDGQPAAAAASQDRQPSPAKRAVVAQATPGPGGDRERYSRGDSNLQFRWEMLIDALALAVARFWQCCGLLVVLALPLFFVVLWVKSRNRGRT